MKTLALKQKRTLRTKKNPGRLIATFKNPTIAPSECNILLRELCLIESATQQQSGVLLAQERIGKFLKELGFKIQFLPNPKAPTADLLIATRKGVSTKCINFVTHSDTVLTNREVGGLRLSENGARAMGSGVIDNKGGLVVLLKGLEAFIEKLGKQKSRYTLRVVCSPNEEGGSVGFNDTFRSLAKDAVMALGFEPALENGDIISSRRGNRWYKIQVKGKEAHAGRSKGEHVNAAHALAQMISEFHKLNSLPRQISVNVGAMIAGRDKYNVVCGDAIAKLDTRFPSFDSRDQLHKKIEKILKSCQLQSHIGGSFTQSSYLIEDDCPPFQGIKKAIPLLNTALESIFRYENRKVQATMAGGAGDVNYMSARGVIVIDGLGPVGGGMHTTSEFVELRSLPTRAQVLCDLLLATELKKLD